MLEVAFHVLLLFEIHASAQNIDAHIYQQRLATYPCCLQITLFMQLEQPPMIAYPNFYDVCKSIERVVHC